MDDQLPAQPDIANEEWVTWMMEKGCVEQVVTYLQNVPPDYVWRAAP